jgi:hypothetical protein
MRTGYLVILAAIVLLTSSGCGWVRIGPPPPEGRAAPSGPPAGAPPAPPRAAAAAEPAAEAPAPEPTAAPAQTSDSGTLSESAYKDAVRPLMRRLRDNGQESARVIERVQGRSNSGDAKDRAASLKAEVEEIEGEIRALTPPSNLQRAQEDLEQSIANQKEFLDAQMEAYDQWSNSSAAARSMQRAGERMSRAMSYYNDAARRLGINP